SFGFLRHLGEPARKRRRAPVGGPLLYTGVGWLMSLAGIVAALLAALLASAEGIGALGAVAAVAATEAAAPAAAAPAPLLAAALAASAEGIAALGAVAAAIPLLAAHLVGAFLGFDAFEEVGIGLGDRIDAKLGEDFFCRDEAVVVAVPILEF